MLQRTYRHVPLHEFTLFIFVTVRAVVMVAVAIIVAAAAAANHIFAAVGVSESVWCFLIQVWL